MTVNIVMFERKGTPVGFKATGHAGYAKHGEDIVCAGISAITLGTVTAAINLLELKEGNYKFVNENGNVQFEHLNKPRNSHTNEVIFSTMFLQLLNINESYPGHLDITTVELGDF